MMLAFFPWVYVDAEVSVGDYVLLPYVRGESPMGAGASAQETIDAVLEPYRNYATHSVSHAALLRHRSRDLFADLTHEEAQEQFVLAELIAFAALAARKFFEGIVGYTNRDAYRLVIQAFQGGSHGVSITARRRDGAAHRMFAKGQYSELRPRHVPTEKENGKMVLDEGTIAGLLAARDKPDWDSVFEAVICFNLANTDSPYIAAEAEAILTIAAFQRILQCETGKSTELIEKFAAAFTPTTPVAATACPRRSSSAGVTDKFRRSASVRHGWLDDFYTLRGNLAHGKMAAPYPSIWDVHEHLLLSAYLFPRLAKSILATRGLCSLDDEDLAALDAFEALACTEHFGASREEDVGKAWHKIVRSAHIRRLVAAHRRGGMIR